MRSVVAPVVAVTDVTAGLVVAPCAATNAVRVVAVAMTVTAEANHAEHATAELFRGARVSSAVVPAIAPAYGNSVPVGAMVVFAFALAKEMVRPAAMKRYDRLSVATPLFVRMPKRWAFQC